VLFLYHYFFSFVYSLMFAIILWDLIIRHSLAKTPSSRTVLIAVGTVAAVVLAAWVYFLPLSYGTPLPSTALEARMWLTTWR
jgi:dolichyl-phosphate-mannose--protein O-mannosyl transferase